jgi:hypothetical protein
LGVYLFPAAAAPKRVDNKKLGFLKNSSQIIAVFIFYVREQDCVREKELRATELNAFVFGSKLRSLS